MGQDRLADLNFTAIANGTILAFRFFGASMARRIIGRNLQNVRRVQEIMCLGLEGCSSRERARLGAQYNAVSRPRSYPTDQSICKYSSRKCEIGQQIL